MGNENLQSDVIYEFWRWEYLRRNEAYQRQYNEFATFCNQLGISGFRGLDVHEAGNELWLENIFETDGAFPVEHSMYIFAALRKIVNTFKISPPIRPDYGISSDALLAKLVKHEKVSMGETAAFYKTLPRANYMPFPFSSVLKKGDLCFQEQQPPDSIKTANQAFLEQNPNIKRLDTIIKNSIDMLVKDTVKKDGKYEIIRTARV